MRLKTFFLWSLTAVPVAIFFIFFSLGKDQNIKEPVGVAKAFLEAYYVSVDLVVSRGLADGQARERIDRQIEAIQKMSNVRKIRSQVSYRFLEERSLGKGKKAFSFELSVEPQGGRAFRRLVFLHLHQVAGIWRVQAFREQQL